MHHHRLRHRLASTTISCLTVWLSATPPGIPRDIDMRISNQLSVKSIEFGCFPAGFSPVETNRNQVKFIPLANPVASRRGYSYGYRVRLATTLKTVRVSSSSMNNNENHKAGDGDATEIEKGCIYGTWPLDGISNGKYWIKVWINDVQLPVIRYEVRFK